MEKGIIPQSEYEKAVKYYREEVLPVAEFFTGVASASRSEMVRSVGHVFQGVIAGKCWSALKTETEYFIEKGKIKQDFITSNQSQSCLIELLQFFEQEIPDQERFSLLKKIYIVTATEELSDGTSPLPLQFMQIAKKLNSGEIMVLFAAYNNLALIVEEQRQFLDILTNESGLKFSELTSIHFESLFNKNLFKKIRGASGVGMPINSLITPLGIAFCDYVSHYDKLSNDGEVNV